MTTGATASIERQEHMSVEGARAAQPMAGNVGDVERWVSAVGGGALAIYGLRHRPGGLLLAALGGALVYRGLSGHCPMYQALGVNTAGLGDQPIHVEKAVTVNKTPAELYRFWRNFENLPSFMHHVEDVRVIDNTNSHWTVKGPAGTTVEWDAEIFLEKPDELIAWRSLPEADVANAGTVRFQPEPGGRGTLVKVVLEYQPPAGRIGATLAKLFGEEPSQQIKDDLSRFKQVMEAGELPTTKGQSAGR